jgi:hypothetical protein
MKTIFIVPFLLMPMMAFVGEPMKFISPDKSSTLVVDKYGERDLIELKSEKTVHRLFHKDLDPIFQPKLAEAFDASLDKLVRLHLPHLRVPNGYPRRKSRLKVSPA